MMRLSTTSELLCREAGRIGAADFRACDREIDLTFSVPPGPGHRPVLYVLASNSESAAPLVIRVNGRAYTASGLFPVEGGWLQLELPEGLLRPGPNSIRIGPQSGWRIPFERASGHPVVRLRLAAPAGRREVVLPRYRDPLIEKRRAEWLTLLPEPLRTEGPRWAWCWDLAGFVSQAWRYRNNQDGVAYAPWDARVIIPWGRRGTDDHGRPAIVMCVHYAVCFVQFCIAMGVPARAVVLTSALDSPEGHFVAEVWLDEFQQWAMIDPNLHLCYRDPETGRPLAVAELASYARRYAPQSAQRHDRAIHSSSGDQPLARLAEFGAGFEFQRGRLEAFAGNECLSGNVYRLWGVWRRHDWAAQPDLAPPAHGSVPYAETDILWCATNEATVSELGMFPHFLTPQQLALAPSSQTVLSALSQG